MKNQQVTIQWKDYPVFCGALSKDVNIQFDIQNKLSFGETYFNDGNIKIILSDINEKNPFPIFPFQFDSMKYIIPSAFLHLFILFTFMNYMPPLGISDDDDFSKDQLFLMQQYLSASAEREQEQKLNETKNDPIPNKEEGGTGTNAKGESGLMGNPSAKSSNKIYGVAGNDKEKAIQKESFLKEAAEFGMIGLLNSSFANTNSPTAPWGGVEALGSDSLSARGNMWGDSIGDSFGYNGLALSGIGESGGGKGEGIGIGDIGTIGRANGLGDGMGFGNGHGWLSSGKHKASSPKVRFGATTVTGRIPPEVVQRIMRQQYGRYRLCFQNGLRNNPNLSGRVTIRFIIGRDGAVSSVSNGGSDMPDPGVINCVLNSTYGLSFPAPDNNIVTVVYPITFESN